jgi:hypothetical protein
MSKDFRFVYVITSERAAYRSDERRNELFSNRTLEVGDTITLDGLEWTVEEKHEREGR